VVLKECLGYTRMPRDEIYDQSWWSSDTTKTHGCVMVIEKREKKSRRKTRSVRKGLSRLLAVSKRRHHATISLSSTVCSVHSSQLTADNMKQEVTLTDHRSRYIPLDWSGDEGENIPKDVVLQGPQRCHHLDRHRLLCFSMYVTERQ
jgi:hypothetical protein